jgi:hypothetical protein
MNDGAMPATLPVAEERRTVLVAAFVPLAVLAAAVVIWFLGDRLAPRTLDRGQFALAVVMPIWFAAPVVAGGWWRRLPDHLVARAALLAALIIGVVGTVEIWQFVALPTNCEYGPLPGAERFIIPAAVVGATLGALIALTASLAQRLLKGGISASGVAISVGASVLATFLTIVAGVLLLGSAHCNSPAG